MTFSSGLAHPIGVHAQVSGQKDNVLVNQKLSGEGVPGALTERAQISSAER
jgi:hypothetical protein